MAHVLATATDASYTASTAVDTRYVPNTVHWESGNTASRSSTGDSVSTLDVSTNVVNKTAFLADEDLNYVKGEDYDFTEEELKRLTMPSMITQDKNVLVATRRTAWRNQSKKNEMLNEDKTQIQNGYGFPYYSSRHSGLLAAKYDYQIIPGDTRFKNMVTLEDKLQSARSSLGLQVHGNNDIARAVKYYMYNRFKVPDTNLAYNRTTTHVFFTRPDLNLLRCGGGAVYGANAQVKNHSDTALLYRTNPYLFKLLTDRVRCGDSNNFNMLLSNQIEGFNIEDETLNSLEVGKSWAGNAIVYGDQYNGRGPGEIRCTFKELQDLSIIKLMKLWITYIDNVSKGAWSPSYDLHGTAMLSDYGSYGADPSMDPVDTSSNGSYVYTKTLDYGASIYVFKCAPDGETVLYWTKYFGVFPTSTGASMLSWDANSGLGQENSRVDISFRYSYKKDLSPISLIEFNELSGFAYFGSTGASAYSDKETESALETGGYARSVKAGSEDSFNPNYNHSSRPFVGAPFIEFDFNSNDNSTALGKNADMFGKPRSNIKLKFQKEADSKLTDALLYRATLSNRSS